MSLYHFEKSVIRSQPWLLCLPYQQVESIEWPVILATFGATFWLVNLYQSLSSAVPSQVPPFWNAKVPRCIRDMDPGHSHQNSSDAKIEGLSISHYPCFGTLSLFVSSVCVCVSALFRYDVPSPNDVWQILVQSYQKLLLHSHTWVAPGKDSSKMEPSWTMMNHEPWILEKNFKIHSVWAKSNYENAKDIKRYCNWNTLVQHQKGHGVAPDG